MDWENHLLYDDYLVKKLNWESGLLYGNWNVSGGLSVSGNPVLTGSYLKTSGTQTYTGNLNVTNGTITISGVTVTTGGPYYPTTNPENYVKQTGLLSSVDEFDPTYFQKFTNSHKKILNTR